MERLVHQGCGEEKETCRQTRKRQHAGKICLLPILHACMCTHRRLMNTAWTESDQSHDPPCPSPRAATRWPSLHHCTTPVVSQFAVTSTIASPALTASCRSTAYCNAESGDTSRPHCSCVRGVEVGSILVSCDGLHAYASTLTAPA